MESLTAAQRASLAPIRVERSRVHNLQDVSVSIPKMALTVAVGPSGSGKSSLVWHTVHAEAQRQHLETFNAFARSRLPKVSQPDVDAVTNLAMPVAVNQSRMGANARSTVATAAELAPLVRLLFSRCGSDPSLLAADFSFNGAGACQKCQGTGSVTELQLTRMVDMSKSLNGGALLHHQFKNRESVFFHRIELSGLFDMDRPLKTWPPAVLEVLLDASHMSMDKARRAIDAHAEGGVTEAPTKGKRKVAPAEAGKDAKRKKKAADTAGSAAKVPVAGEPYRRTTDPTIMFKTWTGVLAMLRERLAKGAAGLGAAASVEQRSGDAKTGGKGDKDKGKASDLDYFDSQACPECEGSRLHARAREATVAAQTIVELGRLELCQLEAWLQGLPKGSLDATRAAAATPILANLLPRVKALCDLGLGYLSLDRPSGTLSGGESQRLRMARHMHCGLTGVLYVLDEPTVGLHARDVERIVAALRAMRDAGNTVVVVEHDSAVIRAADHVVEIGPGSGTGGGRVVFEGTVPDLCSKGDTATSRALAETRDGKHEWRAVREPKTFLEVRDVTAHNLRNVSAKFPLGCLVAVTGVSGSGKSTLVHQGLVKQHPEKVVVVDQSAVGRLGHSNLATYSGAFDHIRSFFQQHTGQDKGLFSFNSSGACPQCNGAGTLTVELMFLDSTATTCSSCRGRRYRDDVLAHEVRGKSVADVLDLTVAEALEFFAKEPQILSRLSTLQRVGLGYLRLGQSLATLSGGEAQRLKMASGLNKQASFYVLDEITSGLHDQDVAVVMRVLHDLVDDGVGIVVIEHNLRAIALCDYVIDVGPGAGRSGGQIIAQGPPADVVRLGVGATAACLREELRL